MKYTSSSAWVRGLVDLFEAQALDAGGLLRAVGLDRAVLNCADARVSTDQVSALWEQAVLRSGNPALGLDRGAAARFGVFDAIAYPILSSPDLRSGMKSMARYMAVLSDATVLELEEDAEGGWLILDHIAAERAVPRQRHEHAVLSVLSMCGWVTRRDVVPLQLDLKSGPPAQPHVYRQAFGCPVRFDSPVTRVRVSRANLSAPLPSFDPVLHPVLIRMLDERMASLGNLSMRRRVADEIRRRLPMGEPRREAVAHRLAVADRTLQRRLRDEQTSYQQILDEVRRDLARTYLSERRSLDDIADLLGFADSSNFFRASRRWFGLSPAQYRAQYHAAVAPQPAAAANP